MPGRGLEFSVLFRAMLSFPPFGLLRGVLEFLEPLGLVFFLPLEIWAGTAPLKVLS